MGKICKSWKQLGTKKPISVVFEALRRKVHKSWKMQKPYAMQWEMLPIPTIHSSEALKRPSAVQTPVVSRKRPKIRVYQDDELQRFRDQDIISGFDDLDANRCPPGYEFKKMDDSVIYYKLEFDAVSSFPKVFGSTRIDKDLHVQLQCNGNPLPLPLWFIRGTDAKLRNYSQLENFPNDIKDAVAMDIIH